MRPPKVKFSVLCVFLSFVWVLMGQISARAQSWSNGYGYRRVITIDHTKVPNTDQTNFPVLVSATYADMATTGNGGHVTNANGYDIIFTSDSAGSSGLSFEQESYSASNGKIVYWIKIPSLSHTSDTTIYMFYGNSSVTTDQSNKTAVWDSNYTGVWHLSETSGQQHDSTSNGNNSTSVSLTAEGTAGQIGGSDQFNGSSNKVELPNVVLTSAFSLETWMYPTTITTSGRILAKAYSSNASPWINYALAFDTSSSQKVSVSFVNSSGTSEGLTSTAAVPLNQWTHLVGTYDGSNLRLYINGSLDSTATASGTVATVSQVTEIGYNNVYSSQSFTGKLDEVRMSSAARSSDWIATQYNNELSPSAFYRVGDANGSNITSISPTSGGSGTSVTVTGTDFGTTQGTSTVTFNGTSATPTSWSDTSITVPVPSGATPGDILVTRSGAMSNGVFFMVPTSWSNGYSYRRAITINHTKVPNSDQTNFPILVSGIYPYLAGTGNGGDVTNANGYDIVFTSDAAGTSNLSFEQEKYDSSTGTVVYWVKIPSLSHSSSETVLYMFYGNSSVTTDQSNKNGVWDSNYKGVWHFATSGSLTSDSTSNATTLTNNGATATTGGQIYGGASFASASSQYLSKSSFTLGATSLTASAWVYSSNLSQNSMLIEEETVNANWELFLETSGTGVKLRGASSTATVVANVPSNSAWHYVVGTISGTTGKVYVDGTLAASGTVTAIPSSSTNQLNIGRYTSGYYFNGSMDDARVSNASRSADWIAAEYNNQSNPSTFYNTGSAYTTSTSVNPTITSLSISSGTVGTSVTITGTDFGSTQGSSTIAFNGAAATPTGWSSTSITVPVPGSASYGPVVATVSGLSSDGPYFTVTPVISALSATTGAVGNQVAIAGSGFGNTQGSSNVLLNGSAMTVNSWSSSWISVTVPTGATSGALLVSVPPGSTNSNSFYFTITNYPLLLSWLDQDIGTVGVTGSGTYANGTFTVQGGGNSIYGTADAFHFVYQPVSGDVTIVARLVSLSGGGTYQSAAVMIRETLTPGSAEANTDYCNNGAGYFYFCFDYRSTTGGSTSNQWGSITSLPYWVKVVRSGNSFSGYVSPNSVDWTQVGTTQTISMATDVYVGLGVTANSTSSLATATFDNVSVNTADSPAPIISSLSATTGAVGSEVLISGSGFGAPLVGSQVLLNESPVTINVWTDTAISIAIPTGATSGYMSVVAAPNMVGSNSIYFTVTSEPLPSPWLDTDIGAVGTIGSATYLNGQFTVNGAGASIGSTADAFHFVYQPLSGDATIIARLDDLTGASSGRAAGVMVRETLTAGSKHYFADYNSTNFQPGVDYRSTTGGSSTSVAYGGTTPPGWVKLVRSGNSFSAYSSTDRSSWTQMSTTQTITMATNVYVGMAVTSGTINSTSTGTVDNVSVDSTATPAPVISSTSGTTGAVGNQITISGSHFGASQGNSLVTLAGLAMTINSWSDTSITFTIPTGASTGWLVVSVAPGMNDSNFVTFTVTANPLPSGWLDTDIGSGITSGSAGYNSGSFTINGAGQLGGTSDSFHYVYQSLSGDGSIVARVATQPPNIVGGGYEAVGGLVIRESLNANAISGFTAFIPNTMYMYYRTSTGGSNTNTYGYPTAAGPYWLRLTRSGSTFAAYWSVDGVYWTQIGSSVSISMATNAYIGMAVNSAITTGLTTGVFDNVTVTAGTPPATPNITSISPTSGTISTSVTVNGSNFGATQGSSTVVFNGVAASSVTSWSNTQIVAAVPSSATTGPLTVVVSGIGSNRDKTFTVYNPVITSVTPPSGAIGGTVIITGSGFGVGSYGKTVQFNGVTSVITGSTLPTLWFEPSYLWTDTTINATIPTGATTGPLTVTVGGITSSGVTFSVAGATTITSISPTAAPVGAAVTINGSNFGSTQSDSAVSFYGSAATTVTSWSNTQIVVTVPSDATSGDLSVTVAGITASSAFTLTSSVTLTDSLGHSSTYYAAEIGGQWVFTQSSGSGCSTCTTRGNIQNTYDSTGNVLTTTDALSHTTTYTYDSSNNRLTQSISVGGSNATTTYTYNSLGEVLTVTDPLGHVTTNAYDSNGNLTSATTPVPATGVSASVTQFAYDSKGELTSITDPLSHATTMAYTSAGLLYTVTDAQSHVTTYAYDSRGNRTSVTDAASNVTSFAYDSGNRLTTTTYPDSSTTTFAYDSRGRRTSVTDQNSKTTSYAYDTADRLTSVTDAASNVTYYGYDTEDNLTSIEDANSHTTAFTYDAYGRVTQTNFPSSYSEYYGYDANNNLTSKTDRKSNTIDYSYDELNRLTQKTYPDTTTVAYTYDLVGKTTQVVDPTGTYSFSYDNMGRLTGTTTAYSFLTGRNFTTSYTYDAASNRAGFTDPESGSTSYSYDTLNRLTTLAPPSAFTSGSFGFSYDALSRRTQMTRPNSVTTNYSYNSLSNLTSVLHQLSGSTIDGASYTVNSVGNRTAKVDQLAAVTSNYTYDNLYELTQVTQGGTTTESYSLDAVGNRTASLGVSSYTTNSSNEMTANSNASYTYDYNGNTTSKTVGSNTTSYAWDYENRLASVTLPGSGGTVYFKYDPLGRRIYKSLSSATSVYAYDGDNLIEETNSSGSVVARYAQTQNIDEPLAMLRSSTTSYYNADGLGSVTSLANGSGTLTQTYTYDSFGKQTASIGSVVNPLQYISREFDGETGLYYDRARYYDTTAGRFVSEDPIRFEGGANFYQYSLDNPVNSADPTGLFPTDFHRDMTYDLARAIFGPKCADKAKAVADANAATDAVSGIYGYLQTGLGFGEGWRKGGPHFPTSASLEASEQRALNTCSLGDLGKATHSIQDKWAHAGWSPRMHWFASNAPDILATQNAATVDNAMKETVSLLMEFKSRCLNCCK
jgi:RHS repeat-associated protein